ncbi:hypothetical protein Pa4123_81900 [Phytohabitans aurantiacus]|uniref:Uncharacterized protein n=1 Tax=Phytohabitans aurantiacus TaxID=3016789 RepID=A0ABQ5R816_9ACTN|nr:hypothetical protein Pa4123_81900 [Phytohabitans aurantiacus]
MTKHQQLRRLRRITTRQQDQPTQDLNQRQVHQPEHHPGIIHPDGKPQLTYGATSSGTVQAYPATAPPRCAN